MGYVHVAADYDGLFGVQTDEVIPKGILPAHAVIQSAQFILGVGRVYAHHIKVVVFQGYAAALMVVLIYADTAS